MISSKRMMASALGGFIFILSAIARPTVDKIDNHLPAPSPAQTAPAPHVQKMCGFSSSAAERPMQVQALLSQLRVPTDPAPEKGKNFLRVLPGRSTLLSREALHLEQSYSARMYLDTTSCGSASAQTSDFEHPFMLITAADLALSADCLANFLATLRHEESHIANSDPKFGISPASPLHMRVTAPEGVSLAMPPYSSSFKLDEFSSYIIELAWSYSDEARKLSKTDLESERTAVWFTLRDLQEGLCTNLPLLAKQRIPSKFKAILPSPMNGVVFSDVDPASESVPLMLIEKTPYAQGREILLGAFTVQGLQVTMPLFVHNGSELDAFEVNGLSPAAALKSESIAEEIGTSISQALALCEGLSVLDQVPENKYRVSDKRELRIIKGDEPQLKAIIPALLRLRKQAIEAKLVADPQNH